MNIAQAENEVGKLVIYKMDGLNVVCLVDEVKSAYGRILYKLIPMAGDGFKWTVQEPGLDMAYAVDIVVKAGDMGDLKGIEMGKFITVKGE